MNGMDYEYAFSEVSPAKSKIAIDFSKIFLIFLLLVLGNNFGSKLDGKDCPLQIYLAINLMKLDILPK